jgi:hypothetical protein
MAHIEWDVAEVLGYERTYQYIASPNEDSTLAELFALRVRSCSEIYNRKIYIVRPGNISIKKIPLVGEMVLIYKTFNEQSTNIKWRESWYYLTTVDVQSSMNENMMPGISNENVEEENIAPGKTFVRKSVSSIQPYEGDVLIDGRNGNSIRFSSTIDLSYPDGYYYKTPSWTGTQDTYGDPIIILSNRTENKTKKEFVVEDTESDASSLYLTSTQNISISLGDTNNKNPLSCYLPAETQFNKSQFIGIADRVILKAKTDIAIIDSPKAIILNTTGEIKLGSDTADQSMVHGDVLLQVLQKILNQLNTPIQCGTMSGTFLDRSNIAAAQQDLQNLLSQKYYINKT